MTTATVVKQLQLSSFQQRKFFQDQVSRWQQETREASSIKSLHAEQIRLLMDGQAGKLSMVDLHNTFEKHLYSNIDKEDFYAITKKELADAKVYLRRFGLDPDLLGEWVDPFEQGVPDTSEPPLARWSTDQSVDSKHGQGKPPPSGHLGQSPTMLSAHAMEVLKTAGRIKANKPVKRVVFVESTRVPRLAETSTPAPESSSKPSLAVPSLSVERQL